MPLKRDLFIPSSQEVFPARHPWLRDVGSAQLATIAKQTQGKIGRPLPSMGTNSRLERNSFARSLATGPETPKPRWRPFRTDRLFAGSLPKAAWECPKFSTASTTFSVDKEGFLCPCVNLCSTYEVEGGLGVEQCLPLLAPTPIGRSAAARKRILGPTWPPRRGLRKNWSTSTRTPNRRVKIK